MGVILSDDEFDAESIANQYLTKPKKIDIDDVSDLLDRIRGGAGQQESGNNYNVTPNARTGALGKFQVLPENVPSWTQKHYGKRLTPQEFQKDTKAQDAVFDGEMGEYLREARRKAPDDDTAIRMAAAGWYGGKKAMHRYDDAKRFRANEPSFREYTSSVLKHSGSPFDANAVANQYLDESFDPTQIADAYLNPPSDVAAQPQADPANPFGYNGKPMLSPADLQPVEQSIASQPAIDGLDDPRNAELERLGVAERYLDTSQMPVEAQPRPLIEPMGATMPRQGQLPRRVQQPVAKQPVAQPFDEEQFNAANLVLTGQGKPAMTREQFEAAVNSFTGGTSVNLPTQAQAVDENGQPIADIAGASYREPIQQQEIQERNAGGAYAEVIDIPDTVKTQKEAADYVLNQLRAKYPAGTFSNTQFPVQWEKGDAKIGITFDSLKNAGVDTAPLIREKVVQNRVENPQVDLSLRKRRVPEPEAEKEIENRIKQPDYSFQQIAKQGLDNMFSDRFAIEKALTGMFFSDNAVSDEYIRKEKERLLKEHGSYGKAWDAEQYYQNMSAPETLIRFTADTVQSFTKNLIGGTAKTAAYIDNLLETYGTISVLPEKIRPSLRNAGNALDAITRIITGATPTEAVKGYRGADDISKTHLFEAVQQFEKAIGEDPVLKDRLLGNLSKGTGSLGAFVVLGALMPALQVGKLRLGTGLSGAAQMTGTGYEEGKQEGLSESEAKLYGAWNGLLGMTEMMGAGQELIKGITNPTVKKNLLKGILAASAQEGKQEFFQEVSQTVGGKAALEFLKENDKSTYDRVVNALKRLPSQITDAVVNEGPIAFVLGSVAGGAGGAVQGIRDKKDELPQSTSQVDAPVEAEVAPFEAITQPESKVTEKKSDKNAKDTSAPSTQPEKVSSKAKNIDISRVDALVEEAPKRVGEIVAEKPKISQKVESETQVVGGLRTVDDVYPAEGYIQTRKRPDGKYQLLYRGTTNEVFPNEVFNSANEARQTYRAVKLKNESPATAKSVSPTPQVPPRPDRRQVEGTKEHRIVGGGELTREGQERRKAVDAANIDPRTGLGSAIAWSKAQPRIEADPDRAIVSFDINRMKDVNDTTSHDAVDKKVLTRLGKVAKEVAEKHDIPIRDVFTPKGDELFLGVPVAKQEQVRDDLEKAFGTVEIVAEQDYVNKNTGERFKKGDVIPVTLSGAFGQTLASAEKDLQPRKQASKTANPVRRVGETQETAKELWQMTVKEFTGSKAKKAKVTELPDVNGVSIESQQGEQDFTHRDAVEAAFERGEDVPDKVLADYPWLAADKAIKPYVDNLKNLSDKELKAEEKRTGNDLNAWANKTRLKPDGSLNTEPGDQPYFEISRKFAAVNREIDARKSKPNPLTLAKNAREAVRAEIPAELDVDLSKLSYDDFVKYQRKARTAFLKAEKIEGRPYGELRSALNEKIALEKNRRAKEIKEMTDTVGKRVAENRFRSKTQSTSIEDAPDYGVYAKQFPDGTTWYGVKDPNGKADGQGNRLLATREDAQREADRLKKEHEYQQEVANRKEREQADIEAKTKAKNQTLDAFAPDASPMQRGKIFKALEKKWTHEAKVQTTKQIIDNAFAKGDLELTTEEVPRIKDMTRLQEFRATGEQQRAHERRQKEAGNKTVYRVNGLDLGKIAYDYATHLQTTQAPETKADQKATTESAGVIAVPRSRVKNYAYADEVADQIKTPEFRKAEIKSRAEKPSARTGFTKTQTEYLAKALQQHVHKALDKQGFGSADASGAAATLAKHKDDPLSITIMGGTEIDEPPIAVPDDGVLRIKNVEAANKLHQQITGKPIEGIEKAKNASVPSGYINQGVNAHTMGKKPTLGGALSAKERAALEADQKALETGFAESQGDIAQTKTTASIDQFQDYGEKIGGAKKDVYQRLEQIDTADLHTEPLSKVFPRPDFAELVKTDVITLTAAKFLNFIYDQIPSKPRMKHKVNRWVENVNGVISTFQDVLGAKGDDAFLKLWREKAPQSLQNGFAMHSAWLDATGFPDTVKSMQGYEIKKFDRWKDMKGVDQEPVYSIVKDSRIVGDYPTAKDAAEALKVRLDEPNKTTFNLYQDRKTNDYFIGKKGAKGVVRLVEGFKTLDEARVFQKENAEKLEKLWESKKYKAGIERKSTTEEVREAKDWRNGKDIASTEEFAKTFGFKGVEFGNWVKQGATKNERQQAINDAYDAMMDLAELLDIPPKALSLDGQLSLALGARGSGQASAHYERDKIVINLTKTRGKGALAHEWWHGLDNYFSRMRGEKTGMVTEFPSVRKVRDGGIFVDDPRVRKELLDGYAGVVKVIRESGMPERSDNLDATRTQRYWSTKPEMTARAFENYVIDRLAEKNQRNDYLANFRDMGDWAKVGLDEDAFPYPTKDEAPKINKAFDHLFQTMEAVEGENGNVALRKAPDAESKEFLTEILPKAHTEDVIDNISVTVHDDGTAEVSEGAAELIRRTLGTLVKKELISGDSGASFYGMTAGKRTLGLMSKELATYAQKLKKLGYTPEQVQKVKDVSNVLKTLADKSAYNSLWVFETSRLHERVHREEKNAKGYDDIAFDKLQNSPLLMLDKPHSKFQRDNGHLPIEQQISEVAASLINNEDMGWSDIPNFEAHKKAFLNTWADGIVRNNRDTIEKIGYEAWAQNYPTITSYESKKSDTERGEEDQSTTDTSEPAGVGSETAEPASIPERNGERVGAGETAKIGKNREPGKSGLEFDETEAREARAKGQKVAAISRIVGREIYYDPQSHGETDARALQLIANKGVTQAMADALAGKPSAEGMKIVYNEFARQNALYNHYKDNGQDAEAITTAEELADLANAITERQRATGQETEIAKTFDVLSPDIALLMAQRRITNKYGEGAKLTPEQIAATTEIAKESGKIEADIEAERKRLQKASAEERRLSDEKAPRKRPLTTQERLYKEYKAKESQIVAQLKELFPDSPFFNVENDVLRQAAWHGSPHTFDKFDLSKIGTGEGAQAYGHGIYFTDSEDVAQYYKEKLSTTNVTLNGEPIKGIYGFKYANDVVDKGKGWIMDEITDLTNRLPTITDRMELWSTNDQINTLWKLKNGKVERYSGAKYRVDLKPEPDEYLLWDKPLSEQSEKVKKAVQRFQDEGHAMSDPRWFSDDLTGQGIWKEATKSTQSAPEASELLKSLGIRGIKYLDGSSRGKGEGSYNYVLFDSSDIQILDVNGTPITLLEDDAANAERLIDALRPDIESLRNGSDAKSLSKQGFSSLDVPAQNLSLARMFKLAQNLKVRDAIIEAIPVDVVNLLKSVELTPKMLLHQPTVFRDLLSIDRDNPITGLVDASSRLGSDATRLGTESGIQSSTAKLDTASGTVPNRRSDSSESALVATEFGLSDTARMKIRDGLATATASVLAHTDIVPQSFNDADVEIQEVLRMAVDFETDLDPLKQEVVTNYTVGQILEGVPYTDLIQTLEQLGMSEVDAKAIHSNAVDIIKPAREPKTAEVKERIKIRNEHYREAKAFRGDNKSKLSGIAQDAQDDPKYKDNEALIKAIDYLTNVETGKVGRNLNDLINNIRAADPKATMADAEKLAYQAQQAVNDLKAKRKRAKDKAKGISEDARKKINELTIQKRNNSRRMAAHLKQLGGHTDWAMHRFNNIMRGLFVNNWGTQLFNAVQSTTVATPSQIALDSIAFVLKNGLQLNVGENADIQAKDLIQPMAYIFANNKQVATQALAQFPEQYFRIHAGILGDIEIEQAPQADSAHWITKPLHKVLDKVDIGLNKLSHISGAKMQEMHFRNAIIAARFDQMIRSKSKGQETLESALRNGTFHQYISEKDAIKAADDALMVTFASEINDPAGKAMKKAYDVMDNFVPIFLNPVTFARFTYTTTKAMVANPLLFGALDAQVAGGRGYNNKSIAKGVLAYSGIVTAYALMAVLGGDDDRWDTLYVNGPNEPPLSVKRFFPLSSFFYVAHLIKEASEGKPPPTGKELLEGFASLETEYFQYGAPMELAGSVLRLAQGTGNLEDVGKSSAKMLGNFFGGALRFFAPMKQALSVIDKDERTLRDDSDSAKEKFLTEISRTLPLTQKLSNASKKIDPVTDEPVVMPFPLGRMVGLNFVHPSLLSNKDSAATEWANRLFPYGGKSDVMSAEDRNAYFIRKRLKEGVRKGIIDAKTADEKARQYLAKVVSPQSIGRLHDELKLSELQAKIKYSFGMNPKDQKALKTVWDKATEQEKVDLREILRKKKNLTPEFRKEYGLGGVQLLDGIRHKMFGTGVKEADADLDAIAPMSIAPDSRQKWQNMRQSTNVGDLRLGTVGGDLVEAVQFGDLDDLKTAISKTNFKALNRVEREHIKGIVDDNIKEVLRVKHPDGAKNYRLYKLLMSKLQ